MSDITTDVVNSEVVQSLTESEIADFLALEATVDSQNLSMIESAKIIGKCLFEINKNEYFKKIFPQNTRPTFSDFGEYVKWRYNRGKTSGHNYIHVHHVANALENSNVTIEELQTMANTLEVYDEAKKLVKEMNLPSDEVESTTKMIIQRAVETIHHTAPIDDNGNKIINKEVIDVTYNVLGEVAKSGVIEIDGIQVPISLAAIATQDEVTQTLYEQVQIRRQNTYEKIEQKKKSQLERKEVKPIIQKEEEKTWKLICPEHGEVEPDFLSNAGFRGKCECFAVIALNGEFDSRFVWRKENA